MGTGRFGEQDHCSGFEVEEGAFGHIGVGEQELLEDHVAHDGGSQEAEEALPEENKGG